VVMAERRDADRGVNARLTATGDVKVLVIEGDLLTLEAEGIVYVAVMTGPGIVMLAHHPMMGGWFIMQDAREGEDEQVPRQEDEG
jgi:hypothetical protein